MGVVAVIPARGGSKGVPGKNLARVGGVSLVARAVAAALRTPSIDRVIVSTDDERIAAEAVTAGAEVLPRPAGLSVDTASSESALLHAIGELDAVPEVIVFLQATSPFIDPADLEDAVSRVRSGESDVVFSAVETYAFLWSFDGTSASGVNHDHRYRPRRQDRDPHFQETGAFYVMNGPGFVDAGFRFFGRVGIGLTDERRAIDIDTPQDLEFARATASLIDVPAAIDVDAVVTDFDGVHTDDRVVVAADGREFVAANRGDGMGVRLLREAGVPLLILSTEMNPVVTARARKLQVEVLQGVDDKAAALREWARVQGVDLARIAYLGNDINDLGCLALVGWPIAVADARPAVKAAARVVLSSRGGKGAVRELCDRVLAARSSLTRKPKEKV